MEENTFSPERREEMLKNSRKRARKKQVILCLLAMVLVFGGIKLGSSLFGGDNAREASLALATPTPRPTPAIPPASQENNLLKLALDAKGTREKVCYLTFDDGPTKEVTPAVLDVLKTADVKATFFTLGKMLEANPEIAKRAFEEGHLLANHTYSHDYNLLYTSGDSFWGEVEKTAGLIQTITGEEPFPLMRFPGGSQNSGTYGTHKQEYKHLLQEKGYYYADWNSLNGDAEGHNRSAEELISRLKETSGANHIVVLMHDAATKKSTPDALPAIIQYLKEEGYIFKRLDEVPYYGEDFQPPPPDLVM